MPINVTKLGGIGLFDGDRVVGCSIVGSNGSAELSMAPAFAYNFGLALIQVVEASPKARSAALPGTQSAPTYDVEAISTGVRLAVSQLGGQMVADTTMDWSTAEHLRDRLNEALANRGEPPAVN